MKIVTFGPVPIPLPIDEAFDVVFGRSTLEKIHGMGVKVTDWKNNQRKLQFSINIDNVPRELRRFVCGNKLRVASKQEMTRTSNEISVTNKVRMHFLGSELFKVKPRFSITSADENTSIMNGRVEHHALLPPPLNIIAEHFMSLHTQRELDTYRSIICRD